MASISPASKPGMAISLRGVRKHFGSLHAVDGVDLDIPQGEIFGLIGHNGAGKSTLFKMMLGLLAPTSGAILVAGTAVGGRNFRAARRQLGYLPENVVLYDNLDGLETLHFFARLKGAPLAECPAMLEKVGLAHAGKRPVREYSKGMRQRLGFAQALLQWLDQVLREHRDTVFAAFPLPDHNFASFKINILHPQAQALHQAHACAIQQ